MTYIAKPTPKKRDPKPLRSRPHLIPWRIRQEVIDREEGTCAWCGVHGGALVFHHRLLRSAGGRDIPEHGVAVHSLCHGQIHREVAEAKRRRFIVSDAADLALGWLAADEVAT